MEIHRTHELWAHRDTCSKHDLQSLLGQLLYITKCVLNRMLDLLRALDKQELIHLPFKQNLNWLFLPTLSYLLSFFSFLRISNLVPHTIHYFDPIKHLARADVLFASPGAKLLITWSKTLQSQNAVRVLTIPHLGYSPICPVQALNNLLLITPSGINKPLF